MPSDLAHGTLEDAKAAADVSMQSLIRPVRRGRSRLTLALGGCAWDAPMSTLVPRSDFARDILHVYAIITWISVGIALIVGVALAWVLIRYRARPGASGMPPPDARPHLLEISWTIAPRSSCW